MHAKKRKQLGGRGGSGKTIVAGIKDRDSNRVTAKVIPDTKQKTLGRFVEESVAPGAKVYSDDSTAYDNLFNHESVKHSIGEYVRGMAHTNGIESFWSMLKRAHTGTFHRMSEKHLQRYVNEFAGRHNIRSQDTIDQMATIVRQMDLKRLRYCDLVG